MGQCTRHACNWTVVLHFAMLTVFFLGGGGGGGKKNYQCLVSISNFCHSFD